MDAQYADFDEQAERLTGFDQSYIQLTPGAFQGRFLSAIFGPDVAIHVEHCNQALEQSVAGHPDAFTLGVVVSKGLPFLINGSDLTCDDVFISAPGQDLLFRSPQDGAILAVVVAMDKLSGLSGLSEQALDWLLASSLQTRVMHAPQLARRIREDTVQALQSACFEPPSVSAAAAIGDALLTGIASKLSLEIASSKPRSDQRNKHTYDRFLNCRRILHDKWQDVQSMDDLLVCTGGGRRSLQSAFAAHLDMGPLTYHRILRLHLAKDRCRTRTSFRHR